MGQMVEDGNLVNNTVNLVMTGAPRPLHATGDSTHSLLTHNSNNTTHLGGSGSGNGSVEGGGEGGGLGSPVHHHHHHHHHHHRSLKQLRSTSKSSLGRCPLHQSINPDHTLFSCL